MIHDDIPELDAAGLRKFGLTTAAIFVFIFGFALPWLFNHSNPVWPWVVASILSAWAIIWPASLALVYKGWMRVGMILGFINTRIVLFILFYMIFFPIALIIKLVGWDPLKLSRKPTSESSFRVKSTKRDHKHFERPY